MIFWAPKNKKASPNMFVEALELAIEKGCLNVVRFLVETGGIVFDSSIDPFDPLFRAVAHNQLEIARYLFSKGARSQEDLGRWVEDFYMTGADEMLNFLGSIGYD